MLPGSQECKRLKRYGRLAAEVQGIATTKKVCVWGSYGHTPLLGTVADSGGGDISFLVWARKRNLSSKPRIGARIPSAGRAALD